MPTTVNTIEAQADAAALALIQETQLPTDGPFYRKLTAALRQMAGLRKPEKIEKAPTNVRKLLGESFSPNVQFEYRYVISSEGKHVAVAINTNCYGRQVTFAVAMADILRLSIPVPHRLYSEPKIEVLGGDRRSGMMSVEMSITTDLSENDLREAFNEAGFSEGMEYVK